MSKKQVTSGTKAKKTIVNIIIHIFLAILSFIWVLPIFWVVLTSFRGEKGSYVTTFFPKNQQLCEIIHRYKYFELPENVCEYFYHCDFYMYHFNHFCTFSILYNVKNAF